ncbi:MAG: glycosyltransferase family 4 protein [Calditrichaeota bacterium]|nr:glycosyltransferase family 4 protein [Calditrichota bacterium]
MRQRMRICHLQLLPLMTGVQRAMLEVLRRLDPQRFDIWVLCKSAGELTEELAKLGARTLLVPSLVRQIQPLNDLRALVTMMRLFKRHRFRIVHTHSSKTGALGRLAARLAGVDVVFHTVHGLPFHEFSGRRERIWYGLVERLAGLCTDKVIFVNHEERELAVSLRLIPTSRAVTVYNGVDHALVASANTAEARASFRRAWGIPEDAFVVAYVGRLWEQKDPVTLAAIIERCTELPVHFLVVGDGPFYGSLARRFADHRQVTMTGWLREPMTMYPAIDVLVLPSLWEGLSMTLIEAMAFGKPLVASNIKGNRECVRDGFNGFLCAPRAPEEFVRAMERLSHDRGLYRTMSRNCMALSKELFDIEVNARAIIRLYDEVWEGISGGRCTGRVQNAPHPSAIRLGKHPATESRSRKEQGREWKPQASRAPANDSPRRLGDLKVAHSWGLQEPMGPHRISRGGRGNVAR